MPYSYITPAPRAAAARPPHPTLIAEVRQVLGELLRTARAACADGAGYREAFVAPLADLCETAKQGGVSAEQLIIAIKQARATLPDIRRWLGDDEEDVLATVVTVCIEQYFADRARRTPDRPSPIAR